MLFVAWFGIFLLSFQLSEAYLYSRPITLTRFTGVSSSSCYAKRKKDVAVNAPTEDLHDQSKKIGKLSPKKAAAIESIIEEVARLNEERKKEENVHVEEVKQDIAPPVVPVPPVEIVELPTESSISIKKEGVKFPEVFNGENLRIGIISARWNYDIIDGLYNGVRESLTKCGVKPENIIIENAPGAFELPMAAKLMIQREKVDAVVCLGCLIKGETMHFEYICSAASSGIMQVSLDTNTPCLFGVLTVLNKEQAIRRSTGSHNEGLSWGRTAVEMGLQRQATFPTYIIPDKTTEESKPKTRKNFGF